MLSEATVFALSPTATFQPLGLDEGAVVLMVDSGQLYTCNDTTAALLQAIDGARNFGTILDRINAEFEVERDVLAADLTEVIAELEREGILSTVSDGQ